MAAGVAMVAMGLGALVIPAITQIEDKVLKGSATDGVEQTADIDSSSAVAQ